MNSIKLHYFIWFLIIATCLALGSIYFMTSNQNNSSEVNQNTLEQPVEPKGESALNQFDTNSTVSVKKQRIDEVKNSLTIDQQIGQLILARVPENSQIINDLIDYNLGGYLIFGKDIKGENSISLTQKIASWQENALIPMIIASDEEGGKVSRVSPVLPQPFESPGTLYKQGGLELLKNEELDKANLLKTLGINVNLGPVADVSLNPASFIYSRTLELPSNMSLQEASEITSQFVVETVQDFNSVQEGSCLKHFPGYGENGDSHSEIIMDGTPLEIVQNYYFKPFQAGISAGAGSVLISHNVSGCLDPTQPASLSPVIHSILRNNFHFNGVILCDDLDMQGLSNFVDKDTAAVATLNAGTDMIICSNYPTIIPRIKMELENGGISQERFQSALDHVLGWKFDLGLI